MASLDVNAGRFSDLSLDALRKTASSLGVVIAEKDEKDHLILLEALDGTVQKILALPTYEQAPDLTKFPRTNIHRPKAEDNPNNAWVYRFSLKATESTPGGLLEGRTLAIKDNVGIAGVPSTLGTDVIDPYIPTIDATIVTRILNAGGHILGTSTCEYMSLTPFSYSSAVGVVDNPWGKGYTAGGSSSGSAVLVSKGHVDMAIGGDQGGSIRLPSAYSGVVGFKPTYGLVPYTGIASLEPTIDYTGPMTRTVLDNARLLTVLAGYDGIDDRQLGAPKREEVPNYLGILEDFSAQLTLSNPLKGMKVGILKEGFEVPALSVPMKEKVLASVEKFRELGATVEEVSVPIHTLGPALWISALHTNFSLTGLQGQALGRRAYTSPALSEALGKAYLEHPQETFDKVNAKNPKAAAIFLHSKYTANKYPGFTAKAFTHVRQLRDAYEAAFKDGNFNVLITPVTPTVAVRHPRQDDSVLAKVTLDVGVTWNTCPFNLSGHPAMSLPVGFLEVGDEEGQKEGLKMPVGMQIIGKLWDEISIYKAAFAWERAFDWKTL